MEQYKKPQRVGPWTDLYTVGAVLYELVTGNKIPDAFERACKDTLVPPKTIRPDISDDLNDIIMKAVSINPEQRFQTVDELEEKLWGNRGTIKMRMIVPRRIRESRIFWGVLIFFLFAIGIIWWFYS